MKNLNSLFFSIAAITVLSLASCKKDSPNNAVPAAPQSPGNASVNAVPLNGGSILGRWSSEIYYTEYFLNDTLQSTDLDSVQVGQEVIEFMGAGIFNLYLDTTFIESGSYSISGTMLHLTMTSGDDLDVAFGATNTKMRWRNTEYYNDSLGLHKIVGDILFVRY